MIKLLVTLASLKAKKKSKIKNLSKYLLKFPTGHALCFVAGPSVVCQLESRVLRLGGREEGTQHGKNGNSGTVWPL